ncbi:hypothetical protein HPULCUR_008592 [Helicostylum pulchrum]|uniref:Uncharacterized protein n=1 Tax=Helicostylum pulchrum TaxID=562976 RepID=A0ABP9Y827_9FUNG
MIRRRNTTDSNGSWPLCKYYLIHNTGSCDDILLNRKETVRRCGKKKNACKRFSYPISLRDQSLLQLNKKEKSNQIKRRRWSSNKRNTLADLLSRIDFKNYLVSDTWDNKSLNDKRLSDERLDRKWNSIRSYQDTEKIEQEEQEVGPSATTTTATTAITAAKDTAATTVTTATVNTTAATNSNMMEVVTPAITVMDTRGDTSTLMNSSIRTNSSLVANAPSSSAGQDTIITIDEAQEEEVSQVVQQPEKKKSSQKEKLLFLFGFLLFPLWWVGACQYIIQQQDHRYLSEDREIFQILNCLMSLASLLLVGLMIGLTTVWA